MKRPELHSRIPALLLVATLSPAALAEQISLADVLVRARRDAPEIASAEARVEAGEMRLRQARGYRRPDIRLQEIWMRSDSPAEAFALQLNQERFSFPEFVGSDPNNPGAIESATTRIELSMPLYTGGELSSRIDQAELISHVTRENATWSGNGAVLAAAEAYIQLAQAREYVSLLQRSLATVDAHVDVARAYTEQGMLVRSELLRAEVEQAKVRDLLTEAEGRARVAASNLSFRLAAEPQNDWEIESLPTPPALSESLESWIGSSWRRSDLEAARHLLAVGELEIKARRAGLKPKVGIVARHDLVDDTPFGSHGDSSAIMAMAAIDLWSGGRHRAAAAAAAADLRAARREVEQFEDAVALEVRAAFERTSAALERHGTALSAQQAAAESERITKERFAQGVVRMLDVLDATTARRETEMRELVARSEAHLARFQLAVTAGRQPEEALPASSHPDPSISEDTTTLNPPRPLQERP